MKITKERIDQLCDGVLRTEIAHVYEDLGALVEPGILTHQIPAALQALHPFLVRRGLTPVDGVVEIEPLTEAERAEFFAAFRAAMARP